jgi:hypothetical protein
VPLELAERVLALYREKYFDFNVRHFHEKLREQHGIRLSYTWVKRALQGAGLVKKSGRRYDLLVVLDEATSEIYYAQLVEQESTRTVLAALRAVVEKKGLFCALYSDRASHFFETPKAGAKIDPQRLTQVGRALQQLGIRMVPAYSPQARGRSERNFGTWQGRLPQELRLRGIHTPEAANGFLREEYVAEFNRRFAVRAALSGSAFLPLAGQELERIFALQHERVVNRDNTVEIAHRVLQIERTPWRNTLAGGRVTVYEHLDGTLSVGYGPHCVGRFNAQGVPLLEPLPRKRRPKVVEKTVAAPPWKTLRVSHFSTATATTGSQS